MVRFCNGRFIKIIVSCFFLLLFACRLDPIAFELSGKEKFSLQDSHAITTEAFENNTLQESEFFLIVLTRSVKMNFDDPNSFYQSITARDDGSVGHAWILLGKGNTFIECGHTGEFGLINLRYHEGVKKAMREKKINPISYLWEDLKDGRYEEYYQTEKPTYAARFELSEKEYKKIYDYINTYDYKRFSLTQASCSFFAANACALIGIDLGHLARMSVPKYYILSNTKYNMWDDEKYSIISVGAPDILEKSLKKAVKAGLGKDATEWYYRQ